MKKTVLLSVLVAMGIYSCGELIAGKSGDDTSCKTGHTQTVMCGEIPTKLLCSHLNNSVPLKGWKDSTSPSETKKKHDSFQCGRTEPCEVFNETTRQKCGGFRVVGSTNEE